MESLVERGVDFLVIGGGVVGLTIALELKRRHPDAKTTVIEKESDCGLHASGRNSGVIHAGFYYTADSLKARFTREGNRKLRAYCERHSIPVNNCGKLVVTRSAADLAQLDELLKRAQLTGVPLESLTADEARKIEPRVRTFERAAFSPTTATTDPAHVIRALKQDALHAGITIHQNARYLRRKNGRLVTSAGAFSCGYVVNAAGLYADKIALEFGFSKKYRIVPFKGLFLYSDEPPGSIRTNVYPVPDLRYPFLGVHFTLLADGRAKIGPTAIPALWREQYQGWERFDLREFGEIIWRDLGLLIHSGFDFKRLAFEEIQKYSRSRMVALAGELMTGVKTEHFSSWGRPGIRAQLVDITTGKLEMDFVTEGDASSLHILNAVSPAWTCAFSFAEHVGGLVDELSR